MTPEEIARVAYEANRAYQHITGDPAPSPAWDDAPEWQTNSVFDGVRHALDGGTPEQLHESWCELKRHDGWTYGEVKNAETKTHPCLIRYDDLPEHQRVKDELFAAVVSTLDDRALPDGYTFSVYVSIGNPDDKLSQRAWAAFHRDTAQAVKMFAQIIHGAWVSESSAPWQNACWCIEIDADATGPLRQQLARLARRYGQESIAFAHAGTSLVEPEE